MVDPASIERIGMSLNYDRVDTDLKNTLIRLAQAVEKLQPRRDIKYYINQTVTYATPTKPASREVFATASSAGYDRLRLHNDLNRNSEELLIINNGPGTLYLLYTMDGSKWTQDEITIEDGRHIKLYNVYEARVRGVLGTCSYVVTEYPSATPQDVTKAEKIEILSTDKDTHFTGAITQNNQETENITGLSGNRFMIRGVNIQSDQPLKYNLIFWSSDAFNNTDLDTDSFIDFVELDMSSSPAFQIGAAYQYYLNVGNLEIIYEDLDATRELHVSLQNLSAVSKNAGATGEVQLDIKMTPRL